MEPKAELLSLQQVRCFCAALELGSFTAAAAALRVSQPAVAEQIRKLEQILGTELFVRAGRGVLPTDAARAFAEHATRSLRALEDAADSVGELTSLKTGTVSVGVFSGPLAWRFELARGRLPARAPAGHGAADRPQLRGDRGARARGELEAGLVLLPIDDERLDVRPIVRDEVLYVSADARRTREPATIEGLARCRSSSTTPSPPTPTRSAASSPNAPRRWGPTAAARRGRADRHRAAARRRRVGDTYLPSAYTRAPYYPDGLHTTSFSPALYDTFAIVTRSGRASPPASASCSPHWRRTCVRWPTSSTGHALSFSAAQRCAFGRR